MSSKLRSVTWGAALFAIGFSLLRARAARATRKARTRRRAFY